MLVYVYPQKIQRPPLKAYSGSHHICGFDRVCVGRCNFAKWVSNRLVEDHVLESCGPVLGLLHDDQSKSSLIELASAAN